ncbi:MAG: aldo/keto reductase [Bacillota bacterium]|nr:aldo/keto reductase [Bacillota bacterium]
MKQRAIRHLDTGLSVLGHGCWPLGGSAYWGPREQADTDRIIARAIELGVNFFDTAEAYNDGASEVSLARALAGRRHEVLIGSKVQPGNAEEGRTRASLEASLRRLETDYIDVYMLHWPLTAMWNGPRGEEARRRTAAGELRTLEEVCTELENARQEGLIRTWGVSNFGIEQLRELDALGFTPSVNQVAYSLVTRGAEIDVMPWCREHGIRIISYMSLMQGLFSDRLKRIEDLPPQRRRTRQYASGSGNDLVTHGGPGAEDEVYVVLGTLRELAGELGVTMAQLAIAWSMQNEVVASTLVGASSLAQIEANAAAADLVIPAAAMERLDCASKPVLDAIGPNIDYFQSAATSRSR